MFILWLTDLIVSGMHINGFWDLVGGTIVVWARRSRCRPLAVPEAATAEPLTAYRRVSDAAERKRAPEHAVGSGGVRAGRYAARADRGLSL